MPCGVLETDSETDSENDFIHFHPLEWVVPFEVLIQMVICSDLCRKYVPCRGRRYNDTVLLFWNITVTACCDGNSSVLKECWPAPFCFNVFPPNFLPNLVVSSSIPFHQSLDSTCTGWVKASIYFTTAKHNRIFSNCHWCNVIGQISMQGGEYSLIIL